VSSQLSLQQRSEVPRAPESQPQLVDSVRLGQSPFTLFLGGAPDAGESQTSESQVGSESTVADVKPTVLPGTMQRLIVARQRIYEAARAGLRIRTYEVALDLDMSEFHFARQFRLAFDRSPHVYYDEVRAETARAMLGEGLSEGIVARRIGFRRPAELRALLGKRPAGTLPAELSKV